MRMQTQLDPTWADALCYVTVAVVGDFAAPFVYVHGWCSEGPHDSVQNQLPPAHYAINVALGTSFLGVNLWHRKRTVR